MHFDEERIQRFLHGQLTPESAALAGNHLGECGECRSRVDEAEAEERRVLGLLRQLDHPAPHIDVRRVMGTRRQRRNATLARWAAGILLLLGVGGAAYAAPGSPLRALVDRLILRNATARDRPVRPVPRDAPMLGGSDNVTQGVAATPTDSFTIELSSLQTGTAVTVSLTDGAEIVVRAVGGHATFTSDVDRIAITAAASTARFEIDIPRHAPWVEIRGGGRRVFLKNGSSIGADSERGVDGRYFLRL